jgi:O-antigen ligase
MTPLPATSASLGSGTGNTAPSTPVRPMPRYVQASLPVFLLFLAFVIVRYVQAGERMDILRAIRLEFLLGGASIIMACIQISVRRPEIGQGRLLLISILLLFACMVVQLPMAADPVLARKIFNDRAFKFAMLSFLTVVYVESPKYLTWFLGAFLFSIFYITLESVQGLLDGGLYWENQGVMRLHGAVPLYAHPNSLGGVALGVLPYILYLWPHSPKWYLRACLLALAVTSSICVVYSGSRTAYLGLVGLVLWMFYISRRKGRFFIRAALITVIIVAVLPDQYIDRFKSIGGKEKEGNSKGTRMEIIRDAWTIFLENPLGVGVASFPAKRMERFGREQDTHNLYLEVATNLGIQGLIVFLFMVASLMIVLRRSTLAFEKQRRRLLALARRGVPPPLRRQLGVHDRDLKYLIAVAHATGGFIFIRLILGLFGMDLYEIYWWFGSGIALVLAGLVVTTRRRLGVLVEAAAVAEAARQAEGSHA